MDSIMKCQQKLEITHSDVEIDQLPIYTVMDGKLMIQTRRYQHIDRPSKRRKMSTHSNDEESSIEDSTKSYCVSSEEISEIFPLTQPYVDPAETFYNMMLEEVNRSLI